MKKVVAIITLILLSTICLIGEAYAALSCNISMQVGKAEVAKSEQFTVSVNVSRIQSERGIISLGATLEYDKESLELVKIEGKNGWETPTEGASYNSSNGKMAITRNGIGKNDETVFEMTFKVKEASKQNLFIILKDITVADGGAQPTKIEKVSQNITVVSKGASSNNTQTGTNNSAGTTQKTNSTNKNNVSNNTKNNTTNSITKSNKTAMTNGKLPKAGSNNIIVIIASIVLIMATTIFSIKIKKVNKKMRI